MNTAKALEAVHQLLENGERFPWEIPVKTRKRAVQSLVLCLDSDDCEHRIRAVQLFIEMDRQNRAWVQLSIRAERAGLDGSLDRLEELDAIGPKIAEPLESTVPAVAS
jgi:hypothetical protein